MSNCVFKGGAIGAVGVRIGKNPWTCSVHPSIAFITEFA